MLKRNKIFLICLAVFNLTILSCEKDNISAFHAQENAPAALANWHGKVIAQRQLPLAGQKVLKQIEQGSPYRYEKDGVVFGNYEQRLPKAYHGFYREYTVPTPFAKTRGARRIVCGGPLRQINQCYYTNNHYRSFKYIMLDQ